MSPDRALEAPVLLLAGGRSSRMGQPKGLLRRRPDGPTWLEMQVQSLAACGLRQVILVLGFGAEEYLSFVQATRFALPMECVVNPRPEWGPFSSIQAGAERVPEGGAWVLPIDVPCPRPETWSALALAPGEAAVPLDGGRGGHPVRISSSLLSRLRRLDPAAADSRLDFQLRAIPAESLGRVEVADPRIHWNLNTEEDWARFRGGDDAPCFDPGSAGR